MAAGMPSVGIGGLFYLATTLLLPFRQGWRRLRGERDTMSSYEIAHVLLIAMGMIVGVWVAGWILGVALSATGTLPSIFGGASSGGVAPRNVVRWATLAVGFVTLAIVLVAVEIAGLASRRRTGRHTPVS